ncbi:MAG: hypothetical protein J0H69_07920 [Burkholderiales bacterium]|jgi:hypothetical protein|nr:hypothetical protein [Burkholderiales bacterium]
MVFEFHGAIVIIYLCEFSLIGMVIAFDASQGAGEGLSIPTMGHLISLMWKFT